MHHIELDIHTNLEKLDNIAIVEDTWNRCQKFRTAPNPNTFKYFPQVQSYNDVLTRVEIGLGRQRARFQIGFNLVYLLGIVLVIRSWFDCLNVILMVIERSRNGLLTCTVAVRMKMLILMVKKKQSVFLSDETYSAGIAVDDIEIFGCALPARQVIVQAVVTILNIKILFW